MKLGSLKNNRLDGELVVVSQDGRRAVKAGPRFSSLQAALDASQEAFSYLEQLYRDLNEGKLSEAFAVEEAQFHSPLPRAYQWLDGSAFLHHVYLVRKARGAELPEKFKTVPLMYQGGSDCFLAPHEDIPLLSPEHGLDFEAEIAVVTDRVPMGTSEHEAYQYIRLLMLVNDVSLRFLIPEELGMGFGFLQSKPASSFSPFAITPDELGEHWKQGRVCFPLLSELNAEFFGNPDASVMHFSFGKLIEHAAKTRNLAAGTIIGSGTVSNEDRSRGSSCLAEKRMLEKIDHGESRTPFLAEGDRIRIEMKDEQGRSLFGAIDQKVRAL